MRKALFIFFIALITFSSCQKESVVGDKDFKTLGTAARDFLTATTYNSLDVEISYMPGYEPSSAVISHLQNFLATHLNKPGGIRITKKQISATGKTIYSIKDVAELERKVRSIFTYGSALTAHVLVLDADYDQEKVLGTSYWNTSICLFGKTFYKYSGGSGQVSRENLYTSLLEHEFGHLLGLVDQGSPMQTPHKENGAHCNNTACLMNFQLETGNNLSGVEVLDAACMADLKANGGK